MKMKKILLLAALFAATVSNAQVVLWNGDDKEVDTKGGFWDRADPTVVEEDGNKCLKVTLKANPDGWDQEHHNAALPVGDANFKGLRRLSFRLKMSDKHNVMVQLEGKDGAYDVNRVFWYDTPNEWQTMVYEYSVGPDAEKITDEGNHVIAIWPFEKTADGEGKTIYIDDIQLEGPMVNDYAVRALEDGSLNDKQIIVTGSLSKGNYQVTWDGVWHTEAYDDYSVLLSKLSANVCFINFAGEGQYAKVADGDSDQLRQKNPNLLILSPEDFYITDNVIRWDGERNRNNTPKMLLNEEYPFYTPIDFHAEEVELTRKVQAGKNFFVLPFWASAANLGAKKVYTRKEGVTFKVDTDEYNANGFAGGNVPFLADFEAGTDKLTFTDKGVCTTPESLEGTFFGVYAPTTAKGMYDVDAQGNLHQLGSDATVKSFHALLSEKPEEATTVLIDGEETGINAVLNAPGVTDTHVYTLDGREVAHPTKGVYIINGKKVLVK